MPCEAHCLKQMFMILINCDAEEGGRKGGSNLSIIMTLKFDLHLPLNVMSNQ